MARCTRRFNPSSSGLQPHGRTLQSAIRRVSRMSREDPSRRSAGNRLGPARGRSRSLASDAPQHPGAAHASAGDFANAAAGQKQALASARFPPGYRKEGERQTRAVRARASDQAAPLMPRGVPATGSSLRMESRSAAARFVVPWTRVPNAAFRVAAPWGRVSASSENF
jgi:hypothetical protein